MDALSADFSMLQVQLGITNSSNPPTTGNWTIEDSDVLLDALLQQKAAVSKAWVALMTVSEEHEVHLPFWAIIPGLVLIGAILFYLVNYMLWAKRENAARMHDLEDAKKHSEHGTLVELEDVWSWFKDIMLSPIPSTHKQPTIERKLLFIVFHSSITCGAAPQLSFTSLRQHVGLFDWGRDAENQLFIVMILKAMEAVLKSRMVKWWNMMKHFWRTRDEKELLGKMGRSCEAFQISILQQLFKLWFGDIGDSVKEWIMFLFWTSCKMI